MIVLKSILVAYDFSSSAHGALQEGVEMAAAFDATLHVLHVVSPPLDEAWAGYVAGGEFLDIVQRLQVAARKRLEELVLPDDLKPVRVTLATAWGNPADEILNYARSHGIGLIVCGTHGRRGWNRVMMGSVAERIVHLAPCPVLTLQENRTSAAA